MNQLRMSCSVSPALGRAEMLPWVQKCADTNPSCFSDCRGVLSKGYVGKKSAKSEVLLHHSATYFMQKHYICWTTQAKMWHSRDRGWVLALGTIGTVYFLLTMFSLFSSKAFPVTPSVSIILSSEEKKNFMRLHLYICLLIITQVR